MRHGYNCISSKNTSQLSAKNISMFSIILIFSIIICTVPAHIRAEQNVTDGITDTWDTDAWRFSHVVALFDRYTDNIRCGGSILTTSIVLTACHCLLKKRTNKTEPAFLLYAMAGVDDPRAVDGKQFRNFREGSAFIVHRKCNMTIPLNGYDVGLGFLEKPFELTKTVRPIRFISTDDRTLWYWLNHFGKRRKICHIVGWGYTDYTTRRLPRQLKDFRVSLVRQKDCDKYACSFYDQCDDSATKNNMICTIPYEKSMACNADPGGALVCNEYIFGIVASVTRDCTHSNAIPVLHSNPLTILELVRFFIPDYEDILRPSYGDKQSVVAPSEYPYVVSIVNVTNKFIPRSICTGSILAKSAVITTCECALKLVETYRHITESYENVRVVAGIINLLDDSWHAQQLLIARLEQRCKSGPENIGVSIVFVHGEFVYATRLVQPLKMLSYDTNIVRKLIKTLQSSGKKCLMATWGYALENPTEVQHNAFREWEVRLKRPKDCNPLPFCSTPFRVCTNIAYDYETLCGEAYGNDDFCDGEPGGPLICEGYFMGVVIFNGELCSRNNSMIITSLLVILDLVEEAIPDYSFRNIVSESKGSWIPMPSGILWCIVFLLIPSVCNFVFS